MATLRRPTPISLTTERPAFSDVVQRREAISVTTERPAFNIVMRRPAVQSIVTIGYEPLANAVATQIVRTIPSVTRAVIASQNLISDIGRTVQPTARSLSAGQFITASIARALSASTRALVATSISDAVIARTTASVIRAAQGGQTLTATVVRTLSAANRSLTAANTTDAAIIRTLSATTRSVSAGQFLTAGIARTLAPAIRSIEAGQYLTADVSRMIPAATRSASATQSLAGDIGRTISAATRLVQANQNLIGAIARTVPAVSRNAVATQSMTGSVSRTLSPIARTVTATQVMAGAITRTAPYATRTASAGQILTGAVTRTTSAVTRSAAGGQKITATVARTAPTATRSLTVSGTLWTPANLATAPKAWWDASDAATISLSGSAVTAWANKGSAGGSASQSTSGSRPAYSASSLNSLPGIVFDNDYLTSTISAPGSYTIAAVLATNTGDTGNYVAVVGDSSTLGGLTVFIGSSTVNYFLVDSSDHEWWSDAVTGGAGQVLDMIKNGTTVTSFQNGTASSGTGGNPHQSMNLGDGIAAISIGYSGGTNYRGTIQEIVLLPYAAGTSDRQKLEGYLAWKWARQSSLPAGHPYKSAAPTA